MLLYPRPGAPLCWLVLGFALSGGFPVTAPAAENQVPPISRYQRTILSLQGEEPEVRADFAAIALMELAEIYLAEADLARREAREGDSPRKLSRWSMAVDRYSSDLLLVAEDVAQGYPVDITVGHNNIVTVTVAGRAVILSHPRADQQAEYDQRVLVQFCTRNDCRHLTEADRERVAIPVSAPQVSPGWAFSNTGPVCSHLEVQVQFDSTANLGRLRHLCGQFFRELLTLDTELAWQRRHGVAVEWDTWSIRPTPGRPEHLVSLNRAGDSILVTIPLIYGTEGLLQDISPWLRARQEGQPAVPLRLEAGRYGW